ncbi:MAG: hypothetical protein JW885_09660 [Deltaproteobacteria bacterium]|nr:hypothetical protein [Candidatus Zymogenaceae bacterium]
MSEAKKKSTLKQVKRAGLYAVVAILLVLLFFWVNHQVKRYHRAEAERLMTALLEYAESYHEENGVYPESYIGDDPDVLKPGLWHWSILVADADEFVARAWMNLDKDEALDIWQVTAKKEPSIISDDILERESTPDPRDLEWGLD